MEKRTSKEILQELTKMIPDCSITELSDGLLVRYKDNNFNVTGGNAYDRILNQILLCGLMSKN